MHHINTAPHPIACREEKVQLSCSYRSLRVLRPSNRFSIKLLYEGNFFFKKKSKKLYAVVLGHDIPHPLPTLYSFLLTCLSLTRVSFSFTSITDYHLSLHSNSRLAHSILKRVLQDFLQLPLGNVLLIGQSVSRMGSGGWFKIVIGLKRSKNRNAKGGKGSKGSSKSHALKAKNYQHGDSDSIVNAGTAENSVSFKKPAEHLAATRIQTAFRAYLARKALRRMKGCVKLQIQIQGHSVKKQGTTALTYLHSWSKMQAEIRNRRLCMVIEDRIRRKKLENQMKLEAKLHDLEVEWCGGSDTMDEILGRIQQREEAAVKRERAMAYAFSHQWRANASQSQGLGNYELSKANWGWSWKERWVAARPWESRVVTTKSNSPKKSKSKQSVNAKKTKPSTPKNAVQIKLRLSNGKETTKAKDCLTPMLKEHSK